MVIDAKLCKQLPIVSGEGRNGHYEIHPYIIEWEEIDGGRSFVQSAKVEFNSKTTKCDELDKIVGLPQTVKMNISLQVKEYQSRYFTEVTCYVLDQNYKVARQY